MRERRLRGYRPWDGLDMSNLRKSDSTELQSRNGQEHQRVFDPVLNCTMLELLEEIKELNKTIKQIHNMEI